MGKAPLDRAQNAYHAHINGASESKPADYLVGFRDAQAVAVVQAFTKISEAIRWGRQGWGRPGEGDGREATDVGQISDCCHLPSFSLTVPLLQHMGTERISSLSLSEVCYWFTLFRWDGLREALLRSAGGGPEVFLSNRTNMTRWGGRKVRGGLKPISMITSSFVSDSKAGCTGDDLREDVRTVKTGCLLVMPLHPVRGLLTPIPHSHPTLQEPGCLQHLWLGGRSWRPPRSEHPRGGSHGSPGAHRLWVLLWGSHDGRLMSEGGG